MSTPLRYNIGIFLFLFFCGNLIAQNQIPFSKPNLPFSFIENKGQIKATSDSSGSDILFYGRDKSVEIYFKSHAVNFQFTEYHIIENDRNFNKEKTPGNQGKIIKKTLHGMGFTLLGSNPQVQISGLKKKESVLNFYLGHTPENGILNVAQFEELWYHNIYDHIDLKFSIQSQGIKYEFVIYPGGNPDQIQMKWEGTTPEIRPEGGIKYANPSGELLESAPVTFTNSGISVESSFHIENTNVVGFKVHKGFQNDTVIIDPVIQWGTFVGGSQFDIVLGMQVDSTGNVYISGQTGSTSGIATTGSFRSSNNGYTDGFISKFNSKGNMIWSTYYGGALNDGLGQMAMGKSNQLYVCGWTESDTGIATSGAWQPNRSGYYDLIFAKFNGNGNRIWASYFGGTDEEDFPSIMLGNNQKIYVSGATASDSLATAGAYQDYNSSPWDLIIACFNDSGTQQYTATYYGGNSNDYWGILFQHPSGKIGIIATTESDAGIATSNAYQDFLWGTSDMAVALFKSDLSDIYWSTYFGGNEDEVGLNAFCDKAGNIYFSGGSSSDTGITDTLSFKPALSGFSDGFYAKFRDTGSRVYSTYFGGNNEDDLLISGFNDSGRLNICGSTTSDSGISMGVSCSQTNYRNGVDCYFGEMDTTGKSLWASYFGGDDNEYPTNLIVKKDSIYLSGHTYSDTGIATSGAFHTSRGGLLEGFVAKFVRCSLREYFIDTSACNSFTLNGKTYYTTGEYAQHLIAKNKCDSCIHLRLTIRDSSSSSVNITACDSLNYYGSVYKVSGIYNRTTTNKAGCDSVVKLYLTIAQKSDTSISVSGCDSLKFRGISYYSSGNYVQQTTNNAGCDSTINLQVTLNSTKYSTVNSSVCDSMVWYGNTYKTSGNYQKKLTSYKGCDSVVTLNLTVKKSTINSITASSCDSAIYFGTTYKTSGTYTKKYSNSAGCDSVVTLNLTIKKSTDTTINLTGCDSITFRSTKYFSSGNYAQKTTNKAGCDSTINLKITLNSTKYSAINSTVCDSLVWYGNTYKSSGNYQKKLTTYKGCDSVVTLNLTVKKSSANSISASSCDSAIYFGTTYKTSGTYTKKYSNSLGCDSVVTLNLTIKKSSDTTINLNGCDSISFRSTKYFSSGNYAQKTTNKAGCDSTINLKITLNSTKYSAINSTVCDSMVWYGNTYKTSGNYQKKLTTYKGCDSVVTLNLTVKKSSANSITSSSCDSAIYFGITYKASGTYTKKYSNSVGCDSVVTLNLTIKKSSDTTINLNGCDSISFRSTKYFSSGNYNQKTTNKAGCDSTINLKITLNTTKNSTVNSTVCDSMVWYGNTYKTSGKYQKKLSTYKGCDSVVFLNLIVNKSGNSSISRTACDSFRLNGNSYYNTGNYTQHLTNYKGCDSLLQLSLTINKTKSTQLNLTQCDSLMVNQVKYTASGTYTQTLTSAKGCDSILTIKATILKHSDTTIYKTGCDSVIYQNVTYHSNGVYFSKKKNKYGCDSNVYLNITIKNSTLQVINSTACGSIEVNGTTYTQTGTYYQYFTNSDGCNFVIQLNLTINPPLKKTVNVSACNAYRLPGGKKVWTSNGTYTDTVKGSAGCDTAVTVNLTIYNIDTSVTRMNATTLQSNANGVSYQWLDCDNAYAKIPGATSKAYTPGKTGNFAVEVKNQYCTDTSACHAIKTTATQTLVKGRFRIYPNPADPESEVYIQSNLQNATYRILDSRGRVVVFGHLNRGNASVRLPAIGLYLFEITSGDSHGSQWVVVE